MSEDLGGPRLVELEQRLGIAFSDKSLALRALTHKSAYDGSRPVDDNQRLEFLGDAVLQLAVSDLLYQLPGELPEGELTRYRSHLVSRAALAEVGAALGLRDLLVVGQGLDPEGDASESLLADGVEALIAALYLDGSFDEVRPVVERLLKARLEAALLTGPPSDPKSRLQELSLARWGQLPRYEHLAEREGPPRAFDVRAVAPGGQDGRGTGPSKKAAEQDAARQLLQALQER